MPRLLCPLIVFAALAAHAATPDWTALGNAWWAHIQFLADDKLEGRGTGTEAFAKAGAYVTDQFEKAGLRPAGERGGYSQSVEFNVLQLDEANSSLAITQDNKPVPFQFVEDGFLGVTANPAPVDAPAVFIGYGLKIPESNYDDFAGVDLQGKIAVIVTGGPSSVPTSLKAHYQSKEERSKNLAAAGAIGLITIPNPKAEEIPWSRIAGARFSARMELKDSGAAPAPSFSLIVNPEKAGRIFTRAGHTFAEIVAALA